MTLLVTALDDAGGIAAPLERSAQLRTLLRDELERSQAELALPRSGREHPVTVVFAAAPDALLAVLPVEVAVRADPDAAPERGWLVVAAAAAALLQIVQLAPPRDAGDLVLEAGALDGHLALRVRTSLQEDAELAAVAFEEHVAPVARLRARALALPGHVLADAGDWRVPIAAALHSAEAVARLGGRPADADSVAAHEEAVLTLLAPAGPGAARPHDDRHPARRIARRILQRLNGMGKWGGYHTDFRHLARGFAGNERALADEVGEALLDAGLLSEKPSVGQRHVYLNPRRAADIHALIEDGTVPPGLRLP
ncbi:MAG: hypothetical protein QOJ85_3640 [Solirubrobacteraceae bacterium]|jgi:hypothetical protein|nr:hypothetical protein [Solirubrobacteraceae bacterium]MEA2244597.1 hypothetical protein [Solirubrobacteraceae bacterium]